MSARQRHVFMIGAQKAGTTQLAELLGQHPEVTLARVKEPDFFTVHHERGAGWYASCFDRAGGWWLDASTSYSAARIAAYEGTWADEANPLGGVPERIAAFAPAARFIYLLRDPVARAYSAYWHNVRDGNEWRPFGVAVRDGAWYVRVGDYHAQLELYLEHFELEAFKIVFFEDLKIDQAAVARDCLDHLDLDRDIEFHAGTAKHETFQVPGALRALRSGLRGSRLATALVEGVVGCVPDGLKQRLKSGLTRPIPPMEEVDRAYLLERFRAPNRRLEALLGVSLDRWQG